MKTRLLISLLLIFLCVRLSAQAPTLTSANTGPVVGDYYSSKVADTTGVSPGATGSNQTWDFSGLSIGSTLYDINWVLPSSTPYSSSFPSATVAYSYGGGTMYSYNSVSSSAWSLIGYATTASTWSYDNASTYLTYPLTYGGNFTDYHHATSFYGGIMHYKRGKRIVNADAWGTLILPSGPHSNLLRVKTLFFEKDSSSSGVDSGNVITYAWYDGINKTPAMEMGYVYNASGVLTYRSIKVSVAYSGITEATDSKITVRFLPNPVTGYISMESDGHSSVLLQILNINGQLVAGNAVYENGAHIDVSALPAGIYIIKAVTIEGSCIKKFVKL